MARRPAPFELVVSRRAPAPLEPCPHGVVVRDPGATLYLSGILPRESRGGQMAQGDARAQAELCVGHLRALLQDAGFVVEHLVHCRIEVTELRTLERVRDVWRKLFVGQMRPALTVTEVQGLPEGAKVQVSATAIAPKDAPPPPPPPPGDYEDQAPY